MCSMNTDAMNRRDITKTGTGPLKTNEKYSKHYDLHTGNKDLWK